MRAARILALVVPLLASPGCFVFDEIDKSAALMPSSKDKKKAESETPAKAGKDGEKPATYSQAAQAWWKDAKSLSTAPGEGDTGEDPIVSCRRAGRSQFMRRSDCLAQGGQPG